MANFNEYDPYGFGEMPSAAAPAPGGSAPAPGSVPAPGNWFTPPEPAELPGYSGSSSPTFNIPSAPVFEFGGFRAPTAADMENDPGYRFRADEGTRALERSASARGTLRTGGTLQDLLRYNQNFASQEYGNAFDRTLRGYTTNRDTASLAFAPRMAEWSMLANAERQRGMAAFQREWDMYSTANSNRLQQHATATNILGSIPPPTPPQV